MKTILHSVPTISKEDIAAVVSVLESRHLEDGEVVEKFEKAMAGYIGRKYSLATSSGFGAVHLALIGLGISEGAEVILPAYCCPAILNPVRLLGAVPVVVDIEENGFNISVEEAKASISKKTAALIVPHMFGFPARIDEIRELGIPVIEDCAQSIGGSYKGKKIGSFSEVSVFSFYASKMLCTGDGGMVLTDDPEMYRRMEDYRYYGHRRGHKYTAFNYHLTNLPATLGLSQLKRIDEFVKTRKEIAGIYDRMLEDNKNIFIDFRGKDDSIYYRYPVRIKNRDAFKEKLARRNIFTGYGVLEGLHQLLEKSPRPCKNTERFLESILSLPIYPSLSPADAERVAFELKIIISE